jgi:hypothetical protein
MSLDKRVIQEEWRTLISATPTHDEFWGKVFPELMPCLWRGGANQLMLVKLGSVTLAMFDFPLSLKNLSRIIFRSILDII